MGPGAGPETEEMGGPKRKQAEEAGEMDVGHDWGGISGNHDSWHNTG